MSVSKGRHSLCVRIDWCGSRAITFDARGGEPLDFECGSSLSNWRVVLGLVYISLLRNDYLWLRQKGPNQ